MELNASALQDPEEYLLQIVAANSTRLAHRLGTSVDGSEPRVRAFAALECRLHPGGRGASGITGTRFPNPVAGDRALVGVPRCVQSYLVDR